MAQSQQQQQQSTVQQSHNGNSSTNLANNMPQQQQQQHRLKHRLNTINNNNIQNAMNNNGAGNASPEDFHYAQYMHLAAGFNTRYDQRLGKYRTSSIIYSIYNVLNISGSPYESPRKRHRISPTQQEMRCSVLRENKSPRSELLTSPATHSDDISGHHSTDDVTHGSSGEPSHRFIRDGLGDDCVKREPSTGEGVSPVDHNLDDGDDGRAIADDDDDQGYAEDLRVKMEITNDYSPPTNSITDSLSKTSMVVASSTNHSATNLSTKLLSNSTTTDLLATGVWNASKLTGHKAGSVATADGKHNFLM